MKIMIRRSRQENSMAIFFGIIAVLMSYSVNKSLGWAVLHFLCSWMYVVYWLLNYTGICEWVNSFVTF